MEIPFAIMFFVLGITIGSFLNVVIYRLNTKRSLGGRSACMSCQNTLSWYELVPFFSFVGLKGRCRNCKTKISWQYPLVEISTGLIFVMLFCKLQDCLYSSPSTFIIVYIFYAVIFSILVVVAAYDLKHKIIPDILSIVFGLLAFIGLFFFFNYGHGLISFYFHIPTILELLSGVFIALPFALLWLVSGGRWMGLGDAKLALGIGWFLGISGALSALVIAFWSGAIVGVALVVLSKSSKMKKLGMKSEIPFAPFLVLGTFIAFIFELNLFGF